MCGIPAHVYIPASLHAVHTCTQALQGHLQRRKVSPGATQVWPPTASALERLPGAASISPSPTFPPAQGRPQAQACRHLTRKCGPSSLHTDTCCQACVVDTAGPRVCAQTFTSMLWGGQEDRKGSSPGTFHCVLVLSGGQTHYSGYCSMVLCGGVGVDASPA